MVKTVLIFEFIVLSILSCKSDTKTKKVVSENNLVKDVAIAPVPVKILLPEHSLSYLIDSVFPCQFNSLSDTDLLWNRPASDVGSIFKLSEDQQKSLPKDNSVFKLNVSPNKVKLSCNYSGNPYDLNLCNYSSSFYVFNYEGTSRILIDRTNNLIALFGQYSWGAEKMFIKNAACIMILDHNLIPQCAIKRKSRKDRSLVAEAYIYQQNYTKVKCYSIEIPKELSQISFDELKLKDIVEFKNYYNTQKVNVTNELNLFNSEYFDNIPLWIEQTLYNPLESKF